MLKNKRILLIIILAIALFLIPSICNAKTITATETTQTSMGKTVKWSYELEGDNIINLKCTNKSEVSGAVVIPSTIDGHTVVGLKGGYANSIFFECTGLTEVTIPETVTKIEDYAFDECSSLTKVTLKNGLVNIGASAFSDTGIANIIIPDSVIKIDNYAFSNCYTLNKIELNQGLISIGDNAFQNTAITAITIPNSTITLGNSAFRNCSNLQSLIISDNLAKIGNNAFENCTNLKSVTIPNSVTLLGEEAFKNCKSLTNLVLSNNLTMIKEATFFECTSLKELILPESITTLNGEYTMSQLGRDGAFGGCSRLKKVLIPDTVTTIQKGVFSGCSELIIYGNDNQESKRYAEDNNINFDYITNWNKAPASGDITPPLLKSLEIDYSSAFDWDKGTNYYLVSAGINISIKATFEEIIYGETAPILTIKCGNGEKIELTDGAIQGKYIVYTYTIKDKDKGIISAESMIGGDIADEAGNKVEKYTCPELVDDIWGHFVFANGKGSATTDEGNNGGNNSGDNQTPSTTVTLSSIAITKTPTRDTYLAGEVFERTGMVVTATYSDGTTKQITNYAVSPSGALTTNDTKVIISYTENGVSKTVEQQIAVTQKTNSITLISIKITKAPTKTKYTEGEKFNKSGMVITATYSDGTTKQITNYTFSPSGTLKTTNKKITVTYTENGVTKVVEQTISVVKDTTTKGDNKLPQTGATLLSLALISMIAVAIISKIKYGKFKDI